MTTALLMIVYLVGVLVVLATLLPLVPSSKWWIRVCDFPRAQLGILAVVAIGSILWLESELNVASTTLLLALALSALWQLSWVWRYLPGAPREVRSRLTKDDAPERIALLTTNVLQGNRNAHQLLDIVHEVAPDLIFTVETDEWWCSRLQEGLSSHYPNSVLHPLSNGYGLALFSRLELVNPTIRFLVDESIPSIKSGVRLRCGAVVDLFGLHPQPPAFFQDALERDLELVQVGLEIARTNRPAIVLGDLNDVAWSPTTSRFKQSGSLLDPRRGRGFFNTYPATIPGLRYPLDYIFHTGQFAICEMRVLRPFASDHLPLLVILCLTEETETVAGARETIVSPGGGI